MYLLPGLFMFAAIEAIDIFCIYKFYHVPNNREALKSSDDNIEAAAQQMSSGQFDATSRLTTTINQQNIQIVLVSVGEF